MGNVVIKLNPYMITGLFVDSRSAVRSSIAHFVFIQATRFLAITVMLMVVPIVPINNIRAVEFPGIWTIGYSIKIIFWPTSCNNIKFKYSKMFIILKLAIIFRRTLNLFGK